MAAAPLKCFLGIKNIYSMSHAVKIPMSKPFFFGFMHVFLVFSDQECCHPSSFDFSDVKPTAFHEALAKSGALDISGSNILVVILASR